MAARSPQLYHQPSREAAEEIFAYIAVRNALLDEALRFPTEASLRSLEIANETVAATVRPAREPYTAQSLDGPAAAYERSQCEAISRQIEELRARLNFQAQRAA